MKGFEKPEAGGEIKMLEPGIKPDRLKTLLFFDFI